MEEVNTELLKVRDELQLERHVTVDLRGSGKAAFLYVRSARRAAEVWADEGSFAVELWDTADKQSYAAPVHSQTGYSPSDAVRTVREWM
jgi:hypothetical protein